jgi:putative transposase
VLRRDAAKDAARNVAAGVGERMESLCFLLRDCDGRCGRSFDAVFEADEGKVI